MDTLSPLEYLERLQEEYIVLEFKRSIYNNKKSKNYYSSIMNYKKEKILKLSNSFHSKNIFNDKDLLGQKKDKFYAGFGMPIFKGLCKEDLKMYFLPGQEVSVFDPNLGFSEMGIIIAFSYQMNKVFIKLLKNEEKRWVFIGNVKRLLFCEKVF